MCGYCVVSHPVPVLDSVRLPHPNHTVVLTGDVEGEPELHLLAQEGSTKDRFGFGSWSTTHTPKLQKSLAVLDGSDESNRIVQDSNGNPWMHISDWGKWRSTNWYMNMTVSVFTVAGWNGTDPHQISIPRTRTIDIEFKNHVDTHHHSVV